MGSDAKATDGTYYLWTKIPPEFTSDDFFKYVLHKAHVAFTPGTVFGTNGEGFVRIVMSADESVLNKCFERIQKAGIRFDIPKSKLPADVQKEIAMMSDGFYSVEPKSDRDFRAYLEQLKIQRQPLFGVIKDIPAFSNKSEYKNLISEITEQWLGKNYPEADILPPYKTGTLYPDAHYFTLHTDDGRLQAIANVEIQNDGIAWGRSLNTAPQNQGSNAEIRGCGEAVIARMVSFCLETGNKVLKFATDKPENIRFYKNLGMVNDGTRNFGGTIHTVLKFDEDSMKTFLNKYQINLSF